MDTNCFLDPYSELHELLRAGIAPSLGCTEPVSVAYSAAVAAAGIPGKILSMKVCTDPYLYKNAIHVGIPGTKARGIVVAAALGYVIGNPKKGLRLLEDLSENRIKDALSLIDEGKIQVEIAYDRNSLFIETKLKTDEGSVRAVTTGNHLNVTIGDGPVDEIPVERPVMYAGIEKYDLKELLDFAEHASLQKISFLKEGMDMNEIIAKEGFGSKNNVGKTLNEIQTEGVFAAGLATDAQVYCASASMARMSGSMLPVMSLTGSGNHGITLFLTIGKVAEHLRSGEEKCLRAFALGVLLTEMVKLHTGTLSAMCGCGVAAGIGASAGVTYLLGGGEAEIGAAVRNMVGSITGIICDGAKEGCAYKVALASGWAVQAALLAVHGSSIDGNNGIVDDDCIKIIKKLGYVCNQGMVATNKTILSLIMEGIPKN